MSDKLDAAETELTRLRDILRVMSRRGYGLNESATAEEQAEYWYRQTERLRGMARRALDGDLKQAVAVGLADAVAGRFSTRTVAQIAEDVLASRKP